jgi:hypothetical protein
MENGRPAPPRIGVPTGPPREIRLACLVFGLRLGRCGTTFSRLLRQSRSDTAGSECEKLTYRLASQ